MHLFFLLRIGRIHHMDDDVRILYLFQRALKGLDQMMRQFADKSDGICHQYLLLSRQFQRSCGRIKRCK